MEDHSTAGLAPEATGRSNAPQAADRGLEDDLDIFAPPAAPSVPRASVRPCFSSCCHAMLTAQQKNLKCSRSQEARSQPCAGPQHAAAVLFPGNGQNSFADRLHGCDATKEASECRCTCRTILRVLLIVSMPTRRISWHTEQLTKAPYLVNCRMLKLVLSHPSPFQAILHPHQVFQVQLLCLCSYAECVVCRQPEEN